MDTLNVTGTQIRKNPHQTVVRLPSNMKDVQTDSPHRKREPHTSVLMSQDHG